MTFIDIGAHHGLYTLLASRMVKETGRVVAFEPSPRERRRLRKHVWINRCANVRIEEFALGKAPGLDHLYVVRGRETGCNSRRPPVNAGTTTLLPVRVTSLDEYCRANLIGTVDFIKLDAEGAELEILEGMTDILAGPQRPLFLCEVDDHRTQPWGYPSKRILEYLKERRYEWFGLRADGAPVSLDRKECYNLLAVPVERVHILGL
ncbi:MAG: FkbM family methyltransferase [Acidobacteria bacterium]|nr:FkbM family methyltransferase [Acidobacteriota bacterium]